MNIPLKSIPAPPVYLDTIPSKRRVVALPVTFGAMIDNKVETTVRIKTKITLK